MDPFAALTGWWGVRISDSGQSCRDFPPNYAEIAKWLNRGI
jgi:hypothetical protein